MTLMSPKIDIFYQPLVVTFHVPYSNFYAINKISARNPQQLTEIDAMVSIVRKLIDPCTFSSRLNFLQHLIMLAWDSSGYWYISMIIYDNWMHLIQITVAKLIFIRPFIVNTSICITVVLSCPNCILSQVIFVIVLVWSCEVYDFLQRSGSCGLISWETGKLILIIYLKKQLFTINLLYSDYLCLPVVYGPLLCVFSTCLLIWLVAGHIGLL